MKRFYKIFLLLSLAAGFLTAQPISAPAHILCVGTPGNTTGNYLQQCQTTAGAVYACNNTAGCSVAADWIPLTPGANSGPTNPATCTPGATQDFFNTAYNSGAGAWYYCSGTNTWSLGRSIAGTLSVSSTVSSQTTTLDVVSLDSQGCKGDGATDDGPCFRAAYALAATATAGGNGAIIKGSAGRNYYLNSAITDPSGDHCILVIPPSVPNLTIDLDGASMTLGATFLAYGNQYPFCFNGASISAAYLSATAYNINNATRGQQSVTVTTASQAANFHVGSIVLLKIGNSGTATFGQNIVTSVNSSTGVIGLKYALGKSYATGTPQVAEVSSVTGQNYMLRNFTVTNGPVMIGQMIEGLQVYNVHATLTQGMPFFTNMVQNSQFLSNDITYIGCQGADFMIGPGGFSSSQFHASGNSVSLSGCSSGASVPGAEGSEEGAESVQFVGETINNADTETGSVCMNLASSYDVSVVGAVLRCAGQGVTTSGGATINGSITGGSFITSLSAMASLNGGWAISGVQVTITGSGSCFDVTDVTDISGSQCTSANSSAFGGVVIENAAGAFGSVITGSSFTNTVSGGSCLYVADPGSSQSYQLTWVGNTCSGYTNRVDYAGSANLNLPKKIILDSALAIIQGYSANPVQFNFSGTSGSGACWQALTGTSKSVNCVITGYAQTGTAQTYTFPTAFYISPILAISGGSCGTFNPTTTSTVLTFPANAAMTAESCQIQVSGF